MYIYIYMYMYMYNIGQKFLKIKHKVKWVVKCAYTHSFFSTTKSLRKIRRLGYKQFLYFLLYVNSLKKFFVSKTKFNCF